MNAKIPISSRRAIHREVEGWFGSDGTLRASMNYQGRLARIAQLMPDGLLASSDGWTVGGSVTRALYSMNVVVSWHMGDGDGHVTGAHVSIWPVSSPRVDIRVRC